MSSASKIQAVVKQTCDLMKSNMQLTLSSRQVRSIKRRPPSDTERTNRFSLPVPKEDDVLSILLQAIKELGDGGEDFPVPNIEPVDVEWICSRKHHDPRKSDIQWGSSVQDCAPQIMYVHGGVYFRGSIDESRRTAATLARLTNGQCLSVGYRLAPQHPFPAAILDTLIAYLSLLYPPPGAPHKPIPAASIVLCGDSAGAALCFAIIQIIIQAQKRSKIQGPTILFHGKQVRLRLPVGIAGISVYGDLTHSMPSWSANADKDYFDLINPTLLPNFPKCEIWPTTPPRVNVLCNETVLRHPLVSPVAVADWADFPPIWLCFGEEMMADEGKFIAQRAAQSGVPVVWEQYGAMPHCFAQLPLLNRLPQSQKVFEKWADFCRACVENPKAIETKGTFTSADDMQERSVDVRDLLDLAFEEVKQRMDKARTEAVELMSKRDRLKAKI